MQTANNNQEATVAGDKSAATDTTSSSAVSSPVQAPPTDEEIAEAILKTKQEEEWRADLTRLEYEIQTLRNVLTVKIDEAAELKRKLGITTIVELKQDFQHGVQSIKESETVQKTSAAFKSFGEYASKKLEDMRNSNAFKSVEEKVGGAYTSVKKRVSRSDGGHEDSPDAAEGETSPTAADGKEDLSAMLPESGKPAAAAAVEKPAA